MEIRMEFSQENVSEDHYKLSSSRSHLDSDDSMMVLDSASDNNNNANNEEVDITEDSKIQMETEVASPFNINLFYSADI